MKNVKSLTTALTATIISASLLGLSACSSSSETRDDRMPLQSGYNNGMNLHDNRGEVQAVDARNYQGLNRGYNNGLNLYDNRGEVQALDAKNYDGLAIGYNNGQPRGYGYREEQATEMRETTYTGATAATTATTTTTRQRSTTAPTTYTPTTTSNSAYNSIDSGVTAQDQGTSEYDIRTTRTIRKQVVAQDDFSSNAKNVKIITINGTVVLKGPVKTMAEKNKIASIAANVAGETKVVNEITVVK